jgi:hypothetical protein
MNTDVLHANPGAVSHPEGAPQLNPPFSELLKGMRDSLRAQHPEWVDSCGNSPLCDFYERRLTELLRMFQAKAKSYE